MGNIIHSKDKKKVTVLGVEVEVPAYIVTGVNSETYVFDRVAHQHKGSVSLDQMRCDEVLLAPGVIYRFAG
ncbi:hypothetical protein [Vibrio harveyi]|uniref:hypothetical protein n=1 Tax=Vibrio harveyi TaxID=669 RepID=UPI0006805939|nr:hypothetical protein [Vibrio harveyi]